MWPDGGDDRPIGRIEGGAFPIQRKADLLWRL